MFYDVLIGKIYLARVV